MNARDPLVTTSSTVADAAAIDRALNAAWLPDFSTVEPATRRAARYALQLLQGNQKYFDGLWANRAAHDAAWDVISPLVQPGADEASCSLLPIDDDDDCRNGRARWRSALLNRTTDSLMERLRREDGDAPTQPCIAMLSGILGLNQAETRLLDLLDKRQSVRRFIVFLNIWEPVDTMTNLHRIAAMVGLTVAEVRSGLAPKGLLRSLQLVRCTDRRLLDLEDFIAPGEGLVDLLLAGPASEQALTDLLIETAPAPSWSLVDYPHLVVAAQRVKATLRQAAKTGEAGVNALLFGPPGVGKTEFALAVAQAAGLHLFRIRSSDDGGDGMGRHGRLAAYMIAQRMLMRRRDAVILFDEVEDVFAEDESPLQRLIGRAATGREKGWMNRTLEENPVPAIWITNEVGGMDPAFLRRFLMPVEFANPPRGVRRKMVERHLGESDLPPSLLDQLAADDKLTPAQFGAAHRLLALQGADDAAMGADEIVLDGVAAMRRLLHGSGLPTVRRAATEFDVAFLNIAGGIAPQRIAEALARRGRGSLCFYGAPGTGKTEFAHVLADALDRELVVRQSSDLVSPYIGETEANIATLFRTFDAERSLLFLDEVDSFLRDRRLAQRGWEVSQVNELLQHMERFPGIFIAATNLMEGLDAAALRRFDFKLHFRPLTPTQRLAMFAREVLGHIDYAEQISSSIRSRLASLELLTGGDFANVCRQRELLGEMLTAEDFMRRLMQECRWKTDVLA